MRPPHIQSIRLLVLLNLGACHLHLKDYRQAERCCTRALDIDGNSIKGYYRRARARDGLGNATGALKDVERALALNPAGEDERNSLLQLSDVLKQKMGHTTE